MHIVDPIRTAGLAHLLGTLIFGVPGLIADLMMQKCAICGARWWIGVCPQCSDEAFD
ncbi:MAG: hypothetical protein ACLQU2_24380 [Candidatus Binataceae bacterium]